MCFIADLSCQIDLATQTTLEQILNDLSCDIDVQAQIVADLSSQVNLATQNHIKKGVFMETVIIINMYICVFVSLIYALF